MHLYVDVITLLLFLVKVYLYLKDNYHPSHTAILQCQPSQHWKISIVSKGQAK